MLAFRVHIFIHNFEHFGEVLSEMMRSGPLDSTSTDRNVEFDGCRVLGASESLVFRLASAHNWDSQELFIDQSVDFLDLVLELRSFLSRSVRRVAFLP